MLAVENEALHLAAMLNDVDLAEYVLSRRPELDAPFDGVSALWMAAEYGSLDVLSLLIEHGASIPAVSPSGASAIYVAAQNGHVEAVALLAEASIQRRDRAAISQPAPSGATPLYIAAQCGHLDVVTLLLGLGVSPLPPPTGSSAFAVACIRDHPSVAAALVKAGAPVRAFGLIWAPVETPAAVARHCVLSCSAAGLVRLYLHKWYRFLAARKLPASLVTSLPIHISADAVAVPVPPLSLGGAVGIRAAADLEALRRSEYTAAAAAADAAGGHAALSARLAALVDSCATSTAFAIDLDTATARRRGGSPPRSVGAALTSAAAAGGGDDDVFGTSADPWRGPAADSTAPPAAAAAPLPRRSARVGGGLPFGAPARAVTGRVDPSRGRSAPGGGRGAGPPGTGSAAGRPGGAQDSGGGDAAGPRRGRLALSLVGSSRGAAADRSITAPFATRRSSSAATGAADGEAEAPPTLRGMPSAAAARAAARAAAPAVRGSTPSGNPFSSTRRRDREKEYNAASPDAAAAVARDRLAHAAVFKAKGVDGGITDYAQRGALAQFVYTPTTPAELVARQRRPRADAMMHYDAVNTIWQQWRKSVDGDEEFFRVTVGVLPDAWMYTAPTLARYAATALRRESLVGKRWIASIKTVGVDGLVLPDELRDGAEPMVDAARAARAAAVKKFEDRYTEVTAALDRFAAGAPPDYGRDEGGGLRGILKDSSRTGAVRRRRDSNGSGSGSSYGSGSDEWGSSYDSGSGSDDDGY